MDRRNRISGLKGSWEWLEFAAQLPANPQFITGQSDSGLVYGGRCILTGASMINQATTAGSFNLLDGLDATGGVVVATALAASGVGGPNLPAQGILCELGVYLQITTATLKGSIWVIPLWHDQFTSPGD